MKSTSPKQLRAELKDYLDLASKVPVRIQRRSGKNFILMNEDKYIALQLELATLQKKLLALSNGEKVESEVKSPKVKKEKKAKKAKKVKAEKPAKTKTKKIKTQTQLKKAKQKA